MWPSPTAVGFNKDVEDEMPCFWNYAVYRIVVDTGEGEPQGRHHKIYYLWIHGS